MPASETRGSIFIRNHNDFKSVVVVKVLFKVSTPKVSLETILNYRPGRVHCSYLGSNYTLTIKQALVCALITEVFPFSLIYNTLFIRLDNKLSLLDITSRFWRKTKTSWRKRVFPVQLSLTYPDPTYPDYSLIRTHFWQLTPFLNRK